MVDFDKSEKNSVKNEFIEDDLWWSAYPCCLSFYSSCVSVSIFIEWSVNPNEKGFFEKKSSSYRIWMFLMSNLIPLNSRVIRPRRGGSLNAYYSIFSLRSFSHLAGFLFFFFNSSWYFLFNSSLSFILSYFLSCLFSSSLYFSAIFSILRFSSQTSCINTIFAIWSSRS